MHPHDLRLWKVFWGIVFAVAFLRLLVAFVKQATKADGVKYNWGAAVLLFFAVGLALYLMFFGQI